MRGIRLSDRVLIAGQTGKGKTTLALYLIENLQPIRTIIFDPKACLRFAGVEPVGDPSQLGEALRGPVCHYIPASFDRKQLEEACELVWVTPGPYLWYVDEASELTNPNYCPEGLALAVKQGREPRKMVIACTQRLAEIAPVFKSQSEHIFMFVPPPIELDLKAIAGNVRREARVLDRELNELHTSEGDFAHLWYSRDTDELRRCAAIPLDGEQGGRTPAQPEPAEQNSPS